MSLVALMLLVYLAVMLVVAAGWFILTTRVGNPKRATKQNKPTPKATAKATERSRPQQPRGPSPQPVSVGPRATIPTRQPSPTQTHATTPSKAQLAAELGKVKPQKTPLKDKPSVNVPHKHPHYEPGELNEAFERFIRDKDDDRGF